MSKVLKFGGTSMGSAASMRHAAAIIEREGAVVTVLSAMSGTTNALAEIASLALRGGSRKTIQSIISALREKYETCAAELLTARTNEAMHKTAETMALISHEADNYRGMASERTILAQGELLTSAIFTMYMQERGLNAVLLDAAGFIRRNGDAKVDTAILKKHLDRLDGGTFYITQGFICSDTEGNIDNLGRGGSDYSAALIGAALGASQVQIWTDIDGMHNGDPRVVEGTFPIRRMHFDEAAELAYFGAKILHPSTVLPCREAGIPVLLKNTMEPMAEGTVISDEEDFSHRYRAVAAKDNITVVRINSSRMLMAYGFLRKVFEVFENYRTPIDMITTSEVAVSLTIDNDRHLRDIVADLAPFGAVEIERDNTIVCVVGRLGRCEHGLFREIIEAVGNVPLKMISYGASHRSLALLVETGYKKEILVNLNNNLFADHAEQGN